MHPPQPVPEVDTQTLAEAMARDEVALVDVREDYEWHEGRIPGAVHVPLGELPGRTGELDRSRRLVLQCRVGGRSAMAAAQLRRAGFDAWSLAGGIERWAGEGRPLTPEGAVVAEH